MIALDFAYHRPTSLQEAARVHAALRGEGRTPLYYAGGTEILSLARLDQIAVDSVVDIKEIPECRLLRRQDGRLVFGAAATLAEICDADLWPLMSAAAGRVADHTTRCKITLGGHIAGSIPYREAALPLLLVSTSAVVAGPQGVRRAPFADLFDGVLRLQPGEFLVQLIVDQSDASWPGISIKRTRLDWVDYPLLTVTAMRVAGELRVALSGLRDRPLRSSALEHALNEPGSIGERVDRGVGQIEHDVLDDIHGSADFRIFTLRQTLREILAELEA